MFLKKLFLMCTVWVCPALALASVYGVEIPKNFTSTAKGRALVFSWNNTLLPTSWLQEQVARISDPDDYAYPGEEEEEK